MAESRQYVFDSVLPYNQWVSEIGILFWHIIGQKGLVCQFFFVILQAETMAQRLQSLTLKKNSET